MSADPEIPGMDGLCWSDLPLTADEIEDLKMAGTEWADATFEAGVEMWPKS